MKKIILQVLTVGLISLMAISANAAWKCKISNARGAVLAGYGPTRAAASANAMAKCSANSAYAKNCKINWCGQGY